MSKNILSFGVVYILCSLWAKAVMAEPALTIDSPALPQSVTLDRSEIEKLPHHIVRTRTPWTQGVTEFEGILLRDLPGVTGGHDLEAEALNAYTARIPANDIKNLDTILAYKVNGVYPSIREKGPFWVIYPRDDVPDMSVQLLDMRMVWQVRRIRVVPHGE